MKKQIITIFALLLATISNAQISFNDVEYWVGSGPDSALLVIDFIDGTPDQSYQWGYLFDASTVVTAETMMTAITQEEPVLDISIAGGFLNTISYNSHAGIGGSPLYWGTWTMDSDNSWQLNSGIGEVLSNSSVFGCTYTDFEPALAPTEPQSAYASLWFSAEDITYWTGEGENEAILIIDFIDDLNYGIPVRYAWGYRFDGEVTAETMLTTISDNDINLAVNVAGGFLNDIVYIDQAGLAGSPDYWGTFSGTNLSDWTLNSGIGEVLTDGSWFGCTYEPWEPSRPLTPLPATDPTSVTMEDIYTWIGVGTDSAAIVIDFIEPGGTTDSFVFGYLFSGSSTGEEALNTLAAEVNNLEINIESGFLNDIIFDGHSGIGGSPNYWGTWSATNVGGWALNIGINTELSNGDWFGCSYTDWTPAVPPSLPTNPLVGITTIQLDYANVYPNPFTDILHIEQASDSQIRIMDVTGKLILERNNLQKNTTIDLSSLNTGVYFISILSNEQVVTHRVIKE